MYKLDLKLLNTNLNQTYILTVFHGETIKSDFILKKNRLLRSMHWAQNAAM